MCYMIFQISIQILLLRWSKDEQSILITTIVTYISVHVSPEVSAYLHSLSVNKSYLCSFYIISDGNEDI